MIDVRQSRRIAARRVWSGTVRRLFQTLGIDGNETAADISESLAVFCQNNTHISRYALSLLIARSFCITGDTDAAARILHHDRAHRLYTNSWLEVLSLEYPFPELYPLFSTRLLRPRRLTSAGALWILDFGKIQLTDADCHELILFQTVRVLTEKVSNVWNGTNGGGTLGIKGMFRLTKRFRERRISPRLLNHIRDVLGCCAQKKGWSRTPSVLCLDL
jgi:hypothetical protein